MRPGSISSFGRLTVALLIALATILIAQPAVAVQAGLPWGAAPQLARKLIRSGSNYRWYMTWAQPTPVSTLSDLQWVPTFWGQSRISAWHSAERYFRSRGKRPKYILGMNEPDVPSQANTSPRAAARQWMEELRPWQRRGSSVGSPQLCWDVTNWLEPFLKALHQLGGKPDFCAAHYYGPATDMGRFKRYVRRVHSACSKHGVHSLWITEIGIMASSRPSQDEVNHFAMQAFRWLSTQSYVKRAAWIGVFEFDSPYDGFMSQKNAYFNSDGSLRTLGRLMAYGNLYRRSMSRASAHAGIIERQGEINGTLADAAAPLDDPRGKWDDAFEGDDHDPDDDAYWDAKLAAQGGNSTVVDDDDSLASEVDDAFEDGFLANLGDK